MAVDERREAIQSMRGTAQPTTTASTVSTAVGTKDGRVDNAQQIRDAGQAAALAYGLTEELLSKFPELRSAYELFLAGDITGARLAYQQSRYYKDLTDIARTRQSKKATQFGAYTQELEQFVLEQQRRLTQRGIRLDDATLRSMLEKAYDDGLSEEQIDLKALASFKGPIGGDVLADVQALKSYANAFGVGYPQSTIDQWSKDIFAGILTVDDVQARVRQDAASAFPAYAQQIDSGISMDAIASAYKSSMANILERDPDSVTFNDPRLRQALQYTVDGKPAVKPLWQFEKELRSTTEWEYTNNAREVVDSLSMKVLRDWGLA